jgi:hypothetical protein
MVDANRTFGEFYDGVRTTEIFEGQIWMDEWKTMVDASRWQEVRQMELADELVIRFAEDMVTAFQERMQSICTDALYNSTSQRGHAFLIEIRDVAQRFGVDVSQSVGAPITPTEAVAYVSRPKPQ